jgi:hypothetical protein
MPKKKPEPVKAKENEARKPVVQKAIADTSGSNLDDFKNKLINIASNDPIIGSNVKYAVAYAKGGTEALAKSVVKEVAINAASYATGKILGKAISAARPMYYGIHGSESGLSKLTPQIGENTKSFLNAMKNIGKTSAETPKVFSYKPELSNVLPVTDYAQMAAGAGKGSAYVVKTPAKNIMSNIVDTSKATSAMDAFAAKGLASEQMSSKAMKVVKEFPISNYTKRTYDTMEAAWETSQNFKPLAGQISAAIQADKKLQSSIIGGMVAGAARAKTIKKK